MWLNRESPCFVLAFCGSALAPPAPCSMDRQLYFPPSSFSLEDHSLSPVNSIFIILEKPGGKKHASRCFHISRHRSVVFVAKNMLKYPRFFLVLLSFFHLQQAAFRWEQPQAGEISQCLRCQLGSQLRAGLGTESPSLAALTNPADVAFGDKVEWERRYQSKVS